MVGTGAPEDRAEEQAPTHRVTPGDVIAGKYRVERVLGEGGMGVVVAATHLTLGELVAVKLLRSDVTVEREEALARFSREARAAAKMRGDHVARVYDVGTLDDGTSYIVLEYLEGQDLDAWLADSGRLPLEVAVGYILEACEALAEAHAAGIVHRDIKPSNLFLATRPDGTAGIKVLDFGISRTREIVPDSSVSPLSDVRRSLTVGSLGTPPYVAPEQIMDSTTVDARADVWALGATLYELVTGVCAFEGSTLYAICTSILRDDPVPPSMRLPGLPKGFDDVVLRCLAKHPADRFQDVAELAFALVPFGPEDAARMAESAVRMLRLPATTPDRLRSPIPNLPERSPSLPDRFPSRPDAAESTSMSRVSVEPPPRASEGLDAAGAVPSTSPPAAAPPSPALVRPPAVEPRTESTPPVESTGDGPSERAQRRARRAAALVLFGVCAVGVVALGIAIGRRVEHSPRATIAIARVGVVADNLAALTTATASTAVPTTPPQAAAPADSGAPSSSERRDPPRASASASADPNGDRARLGRPRRKSNDEDLFHDRK